LSLIKRYRHSHGKCYQSESAYSYIWGRCTNNNNIPCTIYSQTN